MTCTAVTRRTKLAKLSALIALLVFAGLAPVACNTTEGVGKDIKAGGAALENAARDANG